MGEVYRARDVRLDRTVAVKVLSQRVLHRAESRKRFEREARVIASLNHPHICALHDVGQHDGLDFLVMEFVHGETLASRLARAALPTRPGPAPRVLSRSQVPCSRRIALESSTAGPEASQHHAYGFGRQVARLWSGEAAAIRAGRRCSRLDRQCCVVPYGLTSEGVIVGTFHNMAPEQLEAGVSTRARTSLRLALS